MFSLGLVKRSLKIAFVFSPLIIAGYVMGLPYGPKGVAFAYSAVMTLWVLPHIAWCVHGTGISLGDILLAVSRPLASGILAGGLAYIVRMAIGQSLSPLPRLLLESTVLFTVFLGLLLFVAGQKSLYLDILRGVRGPAAVKEKDLVSA